MLQTDQNHNPITTGVSYSILHKRDENRRPSPTSLNHIKKGIYKPSWVASDHLGRPTLTHEGKRFSINIIKRIMKEK